MPHVSYFFATKNDMIEGMSLAEEKIELRYINTDYRDIPEFETVKSIKDIKNLGVNFTGRHLSSQYLVLNKETKLIPRHRVLLNGKDRYFVDQMLNQDSIEFSPSGFYIDDNNFLLRGRIATCSTTSLSDELFKIVKKSLFKNFKRVDGCYVGLEAMNLDKNIKFACISVWSPVLLNRSLRK